jgi:hypothetical protein
MWLELRKNAKTYWKNSKEATSFVYNAAKKMSDKKAPLTNLIEIGKGVPYLGAAIGVFNYFVFKQADEQKPKAPPVSYNSTVSLSGSIVDSIWLTPVNMEVPGSVHSISSVIGEVPMYDEPLGVVSLLKTPTIEYDFIQARHVTTPQGHNQLIQGAYPFVTEYEVVEPLELVVNPSSELTIEEAKVAIVLTYSHSAEKDFENVLSKDELNHYPYIPGASIPFAGTYRNSSGWYAGFNKGSYDHEDWQKTEDGDANLEIIEKDKMYKVSYGQAPISCFHNKSFYLLSEENPNMESMPKIVIRLNITMKNPSTGKYYKFVQSYLVEESRFKKVERETQNYFVDFGYGDLEIEDDHRFQVLNGTMTLLPTIGNNTGNNFGSGFIKDFLIFENETISGNFEAWDGIIIGDNVQIASGSSFLAGRFIKISPNNTIPPEVTLRIGYNDANCNLPPTDFVTTDLTDFCTGTNKVYNPKVLHKHDLKQENEDKKKGEILDFKIYPNPTSGIVTLEVPTYITHHATHIQVMDIKGMLLSESELAADMDQSGVQLDFSSNAPGIYFIRVNFGDHFKVKRIVVQ